MSRGRERCLNAEQLAAVETSVTVRCALLAVGSQVHANLNNFSPGKHVGSDRKSQAAINRLVRKKRKELGIIRNLLKFWEMFPNSELLGTFGNFWELLGTIGNYWELLGTGIWEIFQPRSRP